jgi:hypothetical protein
VSGVNAGVADALRQRSLFRAQCPRERMRKLINLPFEARDGLLRVFAGRLWDRSVMSALH